jgi:GH18 family chitinase
MPVVVFIAETADLRIVCYYTNWSLYREAMPTLYPDHIDPLLCTHIHYAFADINPLTLSITPTEEHDVHWTDRLGMVPLLRDEMRLEHCRSSSLLAALPSYVRTETT